MCTVYRVCLSVLSWERERERVRRTQSTYFKYICATPHPLHSTQRIVFCLSIRVSRLLSQVYCALAMLPAGLLFLQLTLHLFSAIFHLVQSLPICFLMSHICTRAASSSESNTGKLFIPLAERVGQMFTLFCVGLSCDSWILICAHLKWTKTKGECLCKSFRIGI